MTRLITIFIMLSGVVLGQTYNVAITNEVIVGAVTVTALVEIAEGAVTVDSSVNLTNLITIENNTYNQTTITSTGGTIDVSTDGTNYNLEALGGGSSLSVYDSATNNWGAATSITFRTRLNVSGVTNGAIVLDVAGSPVPDWAIGTNVVSYGTVGTQLVTFAAGVSNASIEMWSGGAGGGVSAAVGGAGSWGFLQLYGDLSAVSFMALIPNGGQMLTMTVGNTNANVLIQTDSAFTGGGRGAMYTTNVSNNLRCGGSGGAALLYALTASYTQLVMVVPGGAGSAARTSAAYIGGDGGNDIAGEDGTGGAGAQAGIGATASAHGAHLTYANMMLTNIAPSFLQGGSGGITNAALNLASVGGGSPGFFSGSAGISLTSISAGGGSGVGRVITNEYVAYGIILGGEAGVVPAADRTGYNAAWGVSSATYSEYPLTTRAGPGGAVVRW